MQKRKFKLNIIDIVIFIIVICSVAIIAFRDTINEALTKPEIEKVRVTVSVYGSVNVERLADSKGTVVVYQPNTENDVTFEMNIVAVDIEENLYTAPNHVEITLECSGYKKFGRFYTESGERVYINTNCAFTYGEVIITGDAVSAEVLSN